MKKDKMTLSDFTLKSESQIRSILSYNIEKIKCKQFNTDTEFAFARDADNVSFLNLKVYLSNGVVITTIGGSCNIPKLLNFNKLSELDKFIVSKEFSKWLYRTCCELKEEDYNTDWEPKYDEEYISSLYNTAAVEAVSAYIKNEIKHHEKDIDTSEKGISQFLSYSRFMQNVSKNIINT